MQRNRETGVVEKSKTIGRYAKESVQNIPVIVTSANRIMQIQQEV